MGLDRWHLPSKGPSGCDQSPSPCSACPDVTWRYLGVVRTLQQTNKQTKTSKPTKTGAHDPNWFRSWFAGLFSASCCCFVFVFPPHPHPPSSSRPKQKPPPAAILLLVLSPLFSSRPKGKAAGFARIARLQAAFGNTLSSASRTFSAARSFAFTQASWVSQKETPCFLYYFFFKKKKKNAKMGVKSNKWH